MKHVFGNSVFIIFDNVTMFATKIFRNKYNIYYKFLNAQFLDTVQNNHVTFTMRCLIFINMIDVKTCN